MSITIIRDYWPDAKEVLTDLQFKVVVLRDRQGHSWSEIAFVMGRDRATVRGHYQAAGKRMSDFYEVPKVPPIRTFAHFDWVDDFTMTQEILREGIVRLSAVIKAFAESDENLRLLSFDLDVPELAKTRRLSDGRAVQLPSGRVKGPGGEFSDYADWLKNG